jgi:hypothetical protein
LLPEIASLGHARRRAIHRLDRADVGDFSSAGTSSIRYVRQLDRPFVSVGFGEFDYYRSETCPN